jgi:hypothetical protein
MDNQELEEKLMVEKLGKDYFEVDTKDFIKLPENMSAEEYKQWRKEVKNNGF